MDNSSRTSKAIKNITSGLLNRLVNLFMPFIIRTILIYCIGIQYVGLNSLFTSLLGILSLSELGFGSALTYMMYRPIADNDIDRLRSLLSFFKKVYRIIGLAILVLGLACLPLLQFFIKGDYPSDVNLQALYLIYLFNSVISYFMFAYKSALITAYQRVDINSNISLILYLATSICQAIVILVFKNYYFYAIFLPIYTIAQNIVIGIVSKKMFPEIYCSGNLDHSSIKEICTKTLALTGHKIGGGVVGSLDSIVISAMLGLTLLAEFNNYYLILASLMSVIGVLMGAILPSIGNMLVKEPLDRCHAFFLEANFGILWVVGWFSVCLLCLFQPFMELWVGAQYCLGIDSVILFSLYFYTWQMRVFGVNYKDAAGLWTEDALKPYVASIVNIVLNISLVYFIGLNGALISTIFCMVFIFFPWETYVLYKCLFKRSPKRYLMDQLQYFASWLAIAIITFFICALLPNSGIIPFVGKAIICVVLPNIIYLCLFRKSFKKAIRRLKH